MMQAMDVIHVMLSHYDYALEKINVRFHSILHDGPSNTLGGHVASDTKQCASHSPLWPYGSCDRSSACRCVNTRTTQFLAQHHMPLQKTKSLTLLTLFVKQAFHTRLKSTHTKRTSSLLLTDTTQGRGESEPPKLRLAAREHQ